ncbi:hypothetical protein PoB_000309500 [Plakobranchus ocellatus]|uniref:Uncharacterized protein n=1 Tax=Plakobranchus ocellatus TaxID=259542 RepID=A0AAV3Y105_9GAST|nr:hypothetical protein PoB_000309500 [Plakobranchus ocellatus]
MSPCTFSSMSGPTAPSTRESIHTRFKPPLVESWDGWSFVVARQRFRLLYSPGPHAFSQCTKNAPGLNRFSNQCQVVDRIETQS